MVDVVSWRAYSAEHSLPPQPRLGGERKVQELVDEVVSSTTWRQLVDRPHSVSVVEAPFDSHESWLKRDRGYVWTAATLAVHRDMRWSLNVLHELAHGAAPKFRYVSEPGTVEDLPGHRELHPHGEWWVATYLRLVRQFAPKWYDRLREAYVHYGVAMRADEELAAAIEGSRRAEAEILAWVEAQTDERFRELGEVVIAAQQDTASRRLGRTLGSILMSQITQLFRDDLMLEEAYDDAVTQLVERVSPVVVTTPEHIEVLMDAGTLPQLRADRPAAEADYWEKLAAAVLIVLGVDPIMMLSDLGVTPADLGAVGRELNPGWWTQLDELSAMSKSRPSRWWPSVAGTGAAWSS